MSSDSGACAVELGDWRLEIGDCARDESRCEMTYPFPGMNPWLENPLLWHDVHQALTIALRDDLAARLRPRYFVGVETHTYILIPDEKRKSRYPDVTIVERGGPPVMTATAVAPAPFMEVALRDDPLVENYLVVRLVPAGEIVTVIEILSHANKQPGRDREMYIQKREELLETEVSLVEIDLLRAHPPMPYADEFESDYRILARHRTRLTHARVYPFQLRQPIPIFPLPLLPDDQEPLVNLNLLLSGVYERAGYDLVLNYAEPPVPPLRPEDAAWANECLSKLIG